MTAQRFFAAEFAGTVTAVPDGGTPAVVAGDRTVRVRLHGIDCPEKDQPSGADARRFTADLALGATVTVVEEDDCLWPCRRHCEPASVSLNHN